MHANEITTGATLVSYHEQLSGNVTREDRPVVTAVEPYGSDHVKVRLVSGEVVILRDTATVKVETDTERATRIARDTRALAEMRQSAVFPELNGRMITDTAVPCPRCTVMGNTNFGGRVPTLHVLPEDPDRPFCVGLHGYVSAR